MNCMYKQKVLKVEEDKDKIFKFRTTIIRRKDGKKKV